MSYTRPADISEDIWQHLPSELKFAFSRNINRSFITPMAETTHEELRKAAVINLRINSAGNKLRAMAINSVKDGDLSGVADMVESRHNMLKKGEQITKEIKDLQQRLAELKQLILLRIEFYEAEENGDF
jgi:t-SNARE complex subunit (syntaxin)